MDKKQLVFESQKSFKGLVYKKPLTYDFYIPSCKILIEFQGEQHYKPIPFFGGENVFKEQRTRDGLKRTYAKDNGLRLIEVPYTYNSYEKIKRLLDTTISNNYNAT